MKPDEKIVQYIKIILMIGMIVYVIIKMEQIIGLLEKI